MKQLASAAVNQRVSASVFTNAHELVSVLFRYALPRPDIPAYLWAATWLSFIVFVVASLWLLRMDVASNRLAVALAVFVASITMVVALALSAQAVSERYVSSLFIPSVIGAFQILEDC